MCASLYRLRYGLISLLRNKAQISLMVCAGVWLDGRTDLIFKGRDPEASKDGFSARICQKSLLEDLLSIDEDWTYF